MADPATTTTTPVTTARFITTTATAEPERDKGPSSMSLAYQAAEFAAPMAVTVVVLVVLCLVVGYTKAKRRQRRQAQLAQQGQPGPAVAGALPTVSGGPAFSTAAYHNYYQHLYSTNSTGTPSGPVPPPSNVISGPPDYNSVIPATPLDQPPSYEDSIKNDSMQSGVVNASFQASTESLSMRIDPASSTHPSAASSPKPATEDTPPSADTHPPAHPPAGVSEPVSTLSTQPCAQAASAAASTSQTDATGTHGAIP